MYNLYPNGFMGLSFAEANEIHAGFERADIYVYSIG